MAKKRILIVDDAVVVRRLLNDVISSDPELEVVGTAANGRLALNKLDQLNPDLVTLDIEMPEMDGLETLAELRKRHPKLPVIMFSTLTERGATATLDALSLGASDYVTKPANVGSVTVALNRVRDELVPKIKQLCGVPARSFSPRPIRAKRAQAAQRRPQPSKINAVAIGVSTGGPTALAKVLPQLPADFPVPIVIVQHMPPIFTEQLAKRLNNQSAIKIAEGRAGAMLRPGEAWLAPGGYHMDIERAGTTARLNIHQAPPENSCRPAVDVLFRSVAKVYGGNVLAVIMTGMGSDGLHGCESIHELGGHIIVQDEASSVVWGMPGFVARAGLADQVLPLDQIANAITNRVRTTIQPPSPVVATAAR